MKIDYQTKTESISVHNINFKIDSLLNNQQFSDPDGAAEKLGISSASWPLFGKVWPSARVLAEKMSLYPYDGLRILEIGCGIALPSLVLHSLHADITASDYHPLAETFLRVNSKSNGLKDLKYLAMDWRGDSSPGLRFDLIIGSDIMYERDHPGQLDRFFENHLTENGQVMLADPGRGNQARLGRLMFDRGFSCARELIEYLPGSTESESIRLFSYERL